MKALEKDLKYDVRTMTETRNQNDVMEVVNFANVENISYLLQVFLLLILSMYLSRGLFPLTHFFLNN